MCPGACGARPRLVGDSIRLRRGHLRGHRQKARPARACRFRDGPARDPGKSTRAGCPGHHHQTFKSGHDVRRASRTPLIAPGRKPVEGFSLSQTTHAFSRKRVALSGIDDWKDRARRWNGRSRIFSPLPRASVREKWKVGKKREPAHTNFPGLVPGLAAFHTRAQPDPGIRPGEAAVP